MLAPAVAPRVARMIPLLGSDRAGEVVACAAAIGRTLAGAGASWHDVAAALAPLPPPRAASDVAAMLDDLADAELSAWEARFCASLARQAGRPTAKQTEKLREIWQARHV